MRRSRNPEPPDWPSLVRTRLQDLGLRPEREAEVAEELGQLLADAGADAGIDLTDPVAVDDFLQLQIPRWGELQRTLGGVRRRPYPSIPELEMHGMKPLTGLRNDLRLAWRQLLKRPGFTTVAVLATGLGIGLASAMFSLVDYALLRPLPASDPEELVNIYSRTPDGFLPEEPMAYPDFADIERSSETLSRVTASAMTIVALDATGEATLEIGNMVAANFFDTLGLKPAAGRLLNREDDGIDRQNPVVVLGHSAWQKLFSGSPEAIGSTVRVNGQPLTVVGVTPSDLQGLWPLVEPSLWIPLSMREALGATATTNSGSSSRNPIENRAHRWLWVMARRSPDASIDQVREELSALAAGLREAHDDSNRDRDFVVMPTQSVRLIPAIDSGIRTASMIVMTLVGLVMLIACANVGNMLLARALARRREMATRLSLGAGSSRIVRQLLVEGLLLASLGAAVGLAVAAVSNFLLNRIDLPILIPLRPDLRLDWRVLLFTIGLAAVTAILFALAPALESMRTDLVTSLRSGARAGLGKSQRLQSSLVIAQVCLSLVLLVCAGLSARSLLNAQNIDVGFDPSGVVTASFAPQLQGYESDQWTGLYRAIQDDLAAQPEVDQVAIVGHLPLSLSIDTTTTVPERDKGLPVDQWPDIDTVDAGQGYFQAMGMDIVQGRAFDASDQPETERVVVVNEALAARFWDDENAVGQHLADQGRSYRVVGVARDSKYRTLGEVQRPFYYRNFDQAPDGYATLVVRFRSSELASTRLLSETVRRHDPDLALTNLGSLEEAISPALLLPQMAGRLFGLLGALGLFLAATGLYGVLAYSVTRRTHEIGVRMAMGAQRGSVLGLVLRHGLGLAALGAVLGLGLAAVIARMLGGILYGISASDPWTFIGVTTVLLAVAALACLLPARRALAVDPLNALRYD